MLTIGIDMSKDTFHAAFDDASVSVFANTKNGITGFVRSLTKRGGAPDSVLIGVEATGVYHLLLCETLRSKGWSIKVINPLLTHAQARQTLRKLKTDHYDALTIRKTVLTGAGYVYTDTPEVLALKTLVQERESLRRMYSATKQRVHAHGIREEAISHDLHDSFSLVQQTLKKEIKAIEQKLSDYAPDTQELLRSIPGIGRLSAAALVACIGDIRRFSTPEKLVAYIGLDCRVYQSGTSIHGKGYLSKRGNSYLRFVLFNAAFIARQKNPDLKAYFAKKVKEGKHYYSALCAVERKLVHLVYAVWTRGTPFERR